MGTAGQRCTTLRRLFVHEDVYEAFVGRLKAAYGSVRVGDPREDAVLIGPLIDAAAHEAMKRALADARAAGATVIGGERVETGDAEAFYVRPALVEIGEQAPVVKRETFAPILYVMRYRELAEAIALQNDVAQGLSSSIFTLDLREAELFTSASGSATAASPTSTSGPRARRSAGRSAARRRPAAAANPARTAGGPICAAPPTR
jgi:aldehyde dehydrogenase (NAD+)